MTDYKAIADRLVERGVARKNTGTYPLYTFDDGLTWLNPRHFCHDWRVAGACLEAMTADATDPQLDGSGFMLRTLASPRAIIEAFVEELQDADND